MSLRFQLGLVVLVGCGRLESTPTQEAAPIPEVVAGEDEEVAVASPPPGSGYVSFQMWGDSAALWAHFTPDIPPRAPAPPSYGCRLSRRADASASREASAGTIRVTWHEKGRPFVMDAPWNAKDQRYDGNLIDHAKLDPDTVLAFDAEGAEIPAFQARLSLLAPLTIEAPAKTDVLGPGDLVVSWVTTEHARAWISLHVGLAASAVCFVEAGTRTVTIPGTLVATLLQERAAAGFPETCSTATIPCGQVVVALVRSTEVRAGNQLVSIDHARVDARDLAIGMK